MVMLAKQAFLPTEPPPYLLVSIISKLLPNSLPSVPFLWVIKTSSKIYLCFFHSNHSRFINVHPKWAPLKQKKIIFTTDSSNKEIGLG